MNVIVVGAGMGGLTAALCLHAQGLSVQVFEASSEIRPVGVGINLLPHGTRVLDRFGLVPRLAAKAIETRESIFFDRHGKFIYREPAGLAAGLPFPQFSIHRGDLQLCLLDAVCERLGDEAVITGARCTGFDQDGDGVTVRFVDSRTGARLAGARGDLLVGADGIHSVIRRALHPGEGPPAYSGINMWRGTTRASAFLTGASMVRAGTLDTGKMVIYPIRRNADPAGNQLVNWVAEVRTPDYEPNDWNRPGRLEDFLPRFADWHFDWLDVAGMIVAADQILEYPMVDRDPLPWWTRDRVTLLGDAAHPMYPRGSNGAAHAMIDAEVLARELAARPLAEALAAYEAERRPATTRVVLANRTSPPDLVLETVYRLTGGAPFRHIDDVVSQSELRRILADYRRISGSEGSEPGRR